MNMKNQGKTINYSLKRQLSLNGSFTLAKFVSKTVGDSDMQQSLLYLPWPPWAAQHRQDNFYLCCAAQGDQGSKEAKKTISYHDNARDKLHQC